MKTVTGLFDDYTDASSAVSELEAVGVPSTDISIISNVVIDGTASRMPPKGPELASGSVLLSAGQAVCSLVSA